MNEQGWKELVNQLPIPEDSKESLRNLTPDTYLGDAVEITQMAIGEIESSRKK